MPATKMNQKKAASLRKEYRASLDEIDDLREKLSRATEGTDRYANLRDELYDAVQSARYARGDLQDAGLLKPKKRTARKPTTKRKTTAKRKIAKRKTPRAVRGTTSRR